MSDTAIHLPRELRDRLILAGIAPEDIMEWRHDGQNRYLVRTRPDAQEVRISITRAETGRYWGD